MRRKKLEFQDNCTDHRFKDREREDWHRAKVRSRFRVDGWESLTIPRRLLKAELELAEMPDIFTEDDLGKIDLVPVGSAYTGAVVSFGPVSRASRQIRRVRSTPLDGLGARKDLDWRDPALAYA